MNTSNNKISIIIPAYNEEKGLSTILPKLRNLYEDCEIIVVNDNSSDDTVDVCFKYNVKVIDHPYNKGNGAAIKSGARHASGEIFVMLDADNQHNPEYIQVLLDGLERGFDMVVGARKMSTHAGFARRLANTFYNIFSSLIVGHNIQDLTSGFRAVNAKKFREFLYLLPNGFSYPATITMAFFRAGYSILYTPIEADKRVGKSHIKIAKDGIRFLLIIFKIGTLYSPLKIFIPVSMAFFLAGFSYYMYTYLEFNRFTNMSALLFIGSIIIFLIGLISEQITMLIYKQTDDK